MGGSYWNLWTSDFKREAELARNSMAFIKDLETIEDRQGRIFSNTQALRAFQIFQQRKLKIVPQFCASTSSPLQASRVSNIHCSILYILSLLMWMSKGQRDQTSIAHGHNKSICSIVSTSSRQIGHNGES